MSKGYAKIVDVGKKPIDDYVFNVIVSFQEGVDVVVIKGSGAFSGKAVDVFNELQRRLGDSIELINVEIGSERKSGRTRSYLAIHVKKKY